jgi:N-acetylglucosamine-6-phosphate deacetylase
MVAAVDVTIRASNSTVTIGGALVSRETITEPTVDSIDVGPDQPGVLDLSDLTIHPGFIDQHCHGGGGHSFGAGDVDAIVEAHARAGTTSIMASLVSAPRETLLRQVQALAPRVHDGTLIGIHLEGPWLAGSRCGAHDPSALRDPTTGEAAALVEAGGGAIRMVTIAPELPGALDVIGFLVAHGVIVAVGHTDCTQEQAQQAVDAGATVATHLFNAMPGLHHRDPGPIAALLADPRVVVEIIADGVHVAPSILDLAFRAAGADRVALVSDAMAAAGMGDGRYDLGGLRVDVVAGVARVAGTETLAGSTLTLDAAVRTMARATGDLTAAVSMATSTPADALGLADRGRVEPGMRADLVLLDADARIRGVMRGGSWVIEPT